jgi:hypothetical protein
MDLTELEDIFVSKKITMLNLIIERLYSRL